MASLDKAAHRNGDTNITQREIDLAYVLKDKMARICFLSKLEISIMIQKSYIEGLYMRSLEHEL